VAGRKKAQRVKERIWLSYDLGLRGDYQALYEWLDAKGAKECGDSVATFTTDRSREELHVELTDIFGKASKARIYIVTRDKGGKFLFGTRKAAPWTGFFQNAVESVLDE
jgi:hypothetical protein